MLAVAVADQLAAVGGQSIEHKRDKGRVDGRRILRSSPISATGASRLPIQRAEIGELQHALAAGLLTREQVHAELGDIVAGRRPGRTRDDEITIFDSSGTALQDVAAAIAVYERARATGRGTEVKLDA